MSDPFAPKPRVRSTNSLVDPVVVAAPETFVTCHCGSHQLKSSGEHVWPFRAENEFHTDSICTIRDKAGVWKPFDSQASVAADSEGAEATDD
jgi:hypothetical protein